MTELYKKIGLIWLDFKSKYLLNKDKTLLEINFERLDRYVKTHKEQLEYPQEAAIAVLKKHPIESEEAKLEIAMLHHWWSVERPAVLKEINRLEEQQDIQASAKIKSDLLSNERDMLSRLLEVNQYIE